MPVNVMCATVAQNLAAEAIKKAPRRPLVRGQRGIFNRLLARLASELVSRIDRYFIFVIQSALSYTTTTGPCKTTGSISGESAMFAHT